ncbi:MAG: phenylacetate--CoA ligase family protein [Deltaproteobacteria bacterium]|nr:phenylacetate--CoA ligase family protein [Deltaproteobacteria bacterium]
MKEAQWQRIKKVLSTLAAKSEFYAKKFSGIDPGAIQSREDFAALPFTDKNDLRDAYPLGLLAVPEREVVRIHSSSGTTGVPVIIPYTRQDIGDWTEMFRRCYVTAGLTRSDRVQITPGYGLWTAGIGFQAGAEELGAMVIPTGPGNTDRQIRMMTDLKSTVLCATASYALLLAEEIAKRGLRDKIHLKKGIFGSERWGEKMRRRIAGELGVKLHDIYGLTEIYGPGIGISCDRECGMHFWDDYLYFEIIDPLTCEPLPPGKTGELVITTLRKEGAPLVRYRTHDLTRIIPGECACGLRYPRIDTILGRTDDMVKIRGAMIFPAQIDRLLQEVPGASSEYHLVIENSEGRDVATLTFEIDPEANRETVMQSVGAKCKSQIGITVVPRAVLLGELLRSEKKSQRIFDRRSH